MAKIEWKITDQNVSQEMMSSDNRWHISRTQNGHDKPKFFLTNYDLLLAPHGAGEDYKECFNSFIADCDAYILKVREIRAEALSHMNEMINIEKELAREN